MQNPTNLNSLIKVSENPLDMSKEEDEESEEAEESQELEDEEEEEEESDDEVVQFDFEPQITDNVNAILGGDLNNENHLHQNGVNNPSSLLNSKNPVESNKKYESLFQNKVKKNFDNVFLKPKQTSHHGTISNAQNNQYVNQNTSPNNPFNSGGDYSQQKKSVFTKAAEEAFKKAIKSKSKISCYDDLTNDLYLKKIMEKNDSESNAKFNSFLERTRDYDNRKSIKNNMKTQNAVNAKMNNSAGNLKNTSGSNKFTIRSPEKYMEDQMKFLQNKEQNLKNIRDQKKAETDQNLKKKPEITKKSQSLAKKKQGDFVAKDIHTRLYEESAQKKKVDLLKSVEAKDNEKKLTEKEISSLVEKLFNDAKQRKHRQISYEKFDNIMLIDQNMRSHSNSLRKSMHFRSESMNSLNSSFNSNFGDFSLATNSSKLIILKKFVKEFDLVMMNLNREREEMLFDDYCDVLYNIGFVNYDHKKAKLVLMGVNSASLYNGSLYTEQNNISMQNVSEEDKMFYDEQTLKKLDKELILIKDSWRILTKKKNIEGTEKVEVDQILLFFITVLGLYKGNENSKTEGASTNTNNNNNDNQITAGLNETPNNMPTTPNKTTPVTVIEKESPTSQHKISPIRKSGFSSAISFYAGGILKTPEQRENILPIALPKFDSNKYFYEPKITKQIRVFFRTFYDNRVSSQNKKKEEKKMIRINSYIFNPNMTFKPNVSHRSKISIDDFKDKWIEKAKRLEGEDDDGVDRKLKMSDVYEILRKKKENDLAMKRQLIADNELTECTFQPNLHRNNKFNSVSEINEEKKIRSQSLEVTKRLYSHAMNKLLRIKSIYDEQKAIDISFERDSKECTFAPKTINLKEHIFHQNPLEKDEKVKTEMERYEKARIEKKLKELIMTKGFNSLNKVKNVDDLLSEYKVDEVYPLFRFENEKVMNKDGFNRFHKYTNSFGKRSVERKEINEGEMSERKHKQTSSTPLSPLFTMTIEVEEGVKEKLNYYPNDDPIVLTEKFAVRHGLSVDKKNSLKNLIEKKLAELI